MGSSNFIKTRTSLHCTIQNNSNKSLLTALNWNGKLGLPSLIVFPKDREPVACARGKVSRVFGDVIALIANWRHCLDLRPWAGCRRAFVNSQCCQARPRKWNEIQMNASQGSHPPSPSRAPPDLSAFEIHQAHMHCSRDILAEASCHPPG